MEGSLPLKIAPSALTDSAERSLEILLAPYLIPSRSLQSRLSEADVQHISTCLSRLGKDSWSRAPRLYAVLRMIDHVQIVDSFLSLGISDIWFPFSHKTLPESIRSASARTEFLRLQDAVVTKAFDLEREDGRHRHFRKSEDIPLRKLEELGKGGFGFVDRVVSTVTYKEYARKLIPRGRTFKKNAEVLSDFERELGHLKKMSHIHIVELIGSYTDPKFVGILMSPVADFNLKDFLARESLNPGEHSFLRTFFGCLAAALCYLHENRIRHKDIKPQNVLVKGHQVFLTDFGISLDWSELEQSTTMGVTTKTPRYCAPEVAAFLPRNSLSDLWSLGCVFLEIWTALKGESLVALTGYLERQGSKSTCYYLNWDVSNEWCKFLEQKTNHNEENPPLSWIRGLLQPDQDRRWTAQKLVNSIQETNDRRDLRFAFSGTCCIVSDDSTTSDPSSKRSSVVLEETGASSVGVYDPGPEKLNRVEDTEVRVADLSSSLTIRPSNVTLSAQESSKDSQTLANTARATPIMLAEQTSEQEVDLQSQASLATERAFQVEATAQSSLSASDGAPASAMEIPETLQDSSSSKGIQNGPPERESPEISLHMTPPTCQQPTSPFDLPTLIEQLPQPQMAESFLQPSPSADLPFPYTKKREEKIGIGLYAELLLQRYGNEAPMDNGDYALGDKRVESDNRTPVSAENPAHPAQHSPADIRSSNRGMDSLCPSPEGKGFVIDDGDENQELSLQEQQQNCEVPTAVPDSPAPSPLSLASVESSTAPLPTSSIMFPQHDDSETLPLARLGSQRAEGLRELMPSANSGGIYKKGKARYAFAAQGDDGVALQFREEVIVLDDKNSDERSKVRRLIDSKEGLVPSLSSKKTGSAIVVPPSTPQPAKRRFWGKVDRLFNRQERSPLPLPDKVPLLTGRSGANQPQTTGGAYDVEVDVARVKAIAQEEQKRRQRQADTKEAGELQTQWAQPTDPSTSRLRHEKNVARDDNGYQGRGQAEVEGPSPRTIVQGNSAHHAQQPATSNAANTGQEHAAVLPIDNHRKLPQKSNPGVLAITTENSRIGTQTPNRFGTQEKTCGKCHEKLTGQFVRALGGTFHLDCFKCVDCGTLVASRFFPVDDPALAGSQIPLCETDYFRRIDLLCHACGGALRGSYIEHLRRKYHKEHFTCSQCSIPFGAADYYYEHENEPYCLYHYLAVAGICRGCNTAIFTEYAEIGGESEEKHKWHTLCYMISDLWGVKFAALPDIQLGSSKPPPIKANPTADERLSAEQKGKRIMIQVERTWSVLSTFNDQAATSISGIMFQVLDHDWSGAILLFKSLIVSISRLFRALSMLGNVVKTPITEWLPCQHNAKLLCQKVMGIYRWMSQIKDKSNHLASPTTENAEELPPLIEDLAEYLKPLIRNGLQTSLNHDSEHSSTPGLLTFLGAFEDEYPGPNAFADNSIFLSLADKESDFCMTCKEPVETDCLQTGRGLVHQHCFLCDRCRKSTWDASKGLPITCPHCSRRLPSDVVQVTLFEQYVFLLVVALARFTVESGARFDFEST